MEEKKYATIENQAVYDGHTLDLCLRAAVKDWDRIGETEKKIELFTKVTQCPKGKFMDFLQRLTSAVSTMIPNSEARQRIIASLAFENANFYAKC